MTAFIILGVNSFIFPVQESKKEKQTHKKTHKTFQIQVIGMFVAAFQLSTRTELAITEAWEGLIDYFRAHKQELDYL